MIITLFTGARGWAVPEVFVSRSRIESLRQAGKSWREIAREFNTNTATARRAHAAELER
jgi:IS30 family transposase